MTGDRFIFVIRNTRLQRTNRCTVDLDGWYCSIECDVHKILSMYRHLLPVALLLKYTSTLRLFRPLTLIKLVVMSVSVNA